MTPEEKKFVIHMFDSHGKSMLTRDFEASEIEKLRAENKHLKDLLRKTVSALKTTRNKSVADDIRQ